MRPNSQIASNVVSKLAALPISGKTVEQLAEAGFKRSRLGRVLRLLGVNLGAKAPRAKRKKQAAVVTTTDVLAKLAGMVGTTPPLPATPDTRLPHGSLNLHAGFSPEQKKALENKSKS